MSLRETAVVVMSKHPVAGRVKTRLTPELTDEQAARTYAVFLRHVCQRLDRMEWGRRIVCHDPPECRDDLSKLLPASFDYLPQVAGVLGQKYAVAIAEIRKKSDAVLFVGVDSPDVPTVALVGAANMLKARDIVLGPTEDGGYWSVALAHRVDAGRLFERIEWSSGRELTQTLERGAALGYNVGLAERWTDVDRPADLRRLVKRLRRSDDADDRVLLAQLLSFLPEPFLSRPDGVVT